MIAFVHRIGLVLLGGVFFRAGAEHFLRFRVIAASIMALDSLADRWAGSQRRGTNF
jgi:hypothetical protein